jgi:hypothetical protein
MLKAPSSSSPLMLSQEGWCSSSDDKTLDNNRVLVEDFAVRQLPRQPE